MTYSAQNGNNINWEGSIKDINVIQGEYVYFIEYRNEDGEISYASFRIPWASES